MTYAYTYVLTLSSASLRSIILCTGYIFLSRKKIGRDVMSDWQNEGRQIHVF